MFIYTQALLDTLFMPLNQCLLSERSKNGEFENVVSRSNIKKKMAGALRFIGENILKCIITDFFLT